MHAVAAARVYNQRAGAENLIKEANNDAGLAAHPSAMNCIHCPSLGGLKPSPFRRRLQHARRSLSLRDAGLPTRRAYRIGDPSAPGLDNEISKTSPDWGGGHAGAGSDPGHLRATRGEDYEGPCGKGPRAPVCVDPAAGDDQPTVAVAEREDSAPHVGGLSTSEETVLGQTSVGTWVLLLQFR